MPSGAHGGCRGRRDRGPRRHGAPGHLLVVDDHPTVCDGVRLLLHRDSNPAEAVRRLRASCPTARLVLLTAHPDHVLLTAALVRNVDGCLLKDATTGDLAASLRDVIGGRVAIGPALGAWSYAAGAPFRHQRGLIRQELETFGSWLRAGLLRRRPTSRVEVVSRAFARCLL